MLPSFVPSHVGASIIFLLGWLTDILHAMQGRYYYAYARTA